MGGQRDEVNAAAYGRLETVKIEERRGGEREEREAETEEISGRHDGRRVSLQRRLSLGARDILIRQLLTELLP